MTRLILTALLVTLCLPTLASDSAFEGPLAPFMAKAELERTQVFKGGRFPNVVVSIKGTVLAVFGGVKTRRSEDGGKTWGPEILIGKGFMGGGVTVNETNGDILAFCRGKPSAIRPYCLPQQ
jgi:hypothetical protein